MTMRVIATLVLACGLTCLSVVALVPVARRIGLVDRPGGRKSHDGEVPAIGGLAIVAALITTTLIMRVYDEVHPAFWAGLLVIVLAGTLDDLRELGPRTKFLTQIVAVALMVFWAGWSLQSLGNLLGPWPLVLGGLSTPITFIAVIGVVNAINITDGADGLAGGLVLNALLWLAVTALFGGNGASEQVQIVLALLGAVAGFLAFNLRHVGRRRAFIFLGDAGSLALGFVLAWFMVWGAERSEPLFAPVTAVWMLAVPLMDTLTCAGRRLFNGDSPFKADRKHLHHILVDLGLPIEKAVAVIHGFAFLLAAIGVAGWHYRVPEHVMFYVAMAIFSAYILFSIEAVRFIETRGHRSIAASGIGDQSRVALRSSGAPSGVAAKAPLDIGRSMAPRLITLQGQPVFIDRRKKSRPIAVHRNTLARRGNLIEDLMNPIFPAAKMNRRKTDRQHDNRA